MADAPVLKISIATKQHILNVVIMGTCASQRPPLWPLSLH